MEMIAHHHVGQHLDTRKPFDATHEINDDTFLLIVEHEFAMRNASHHMVTHILRLISKLPRHLPILLNLSDGVLDLADEEVEFER